MKRFCIVIALILSFAFVCGTACAATAQTNPPDDAALEERANEVLDYLSLSGESAYNKIYKIYNYMAQSVEYDWAATGETGWDGVSVGYGQTAYEALCLEKAVCAGIAKAVTYLLDKVNIPCKTVSGLNDGVSHAWNVVKLGNSWYYMDATSDLGTAKYSHFLKTFSDLGDYELSSASASEVGSLPLAGTSYSHEETDALFETAGNYLINPGFGNVTIHSYTGTQKNVVIPATINSRPVKRLVQYFIYENDTMETLTISEGIESIEHLFLGVCTKLKSVSLPSTAGFSSANSGMFQGGGGLIDHCDALETISVSEDNPYLCVVDNVLYNKHHLLSPGEPDQGPDRAGRRGYHPGRHLRGQSVSGGSDPARHRRVHRVLGFQHMQRAEKGQYPGELHGDRGVRLQLDGADQHSYPCVR